MTSDFSQGEQRKNEPSLSSDWMLVEVNHQSIKTPQLLYSKTKIPAKNNTETNLKVVKPQYYKCRETDPAAACGRCRCPGG